MGDGEKLGHMPTQAAVEILYGPELGVGAQVGPYVVDEKRSRGGFATVYRAHDHRGGPPVALKVLHSLLVDGNNMIRRFQQEADAIRRLVHPAIVRLVDLGELADGRPYLVMEWLSGRTLHEELVARGTFGVAEVVEVFDALCGALSTAHAAGIVHRDVKPANVILEDAPGGPRVKLVDFGIAKLVGDHAAGRHDLTSTGVRIGTPHYMAPEQIAGRPVDGRTDVYALGVTLYQLLTGQPPFSAPSPIEIDAQHLHAPPPFAADLAPVSPAVDAVIQRCMAKLPGERYPDAASLLRDLRAAATGAPRASAVPSAVMAGLHLEIRLGPAIDDAALDALEEALAAARRRCVAAGLTVAAGAGAGILAVGASREAALDLALALAAGPRPGLELAISVHAAGAAIAGGRVVGGELLQLAGWVAPEAGVVASAAALEGLEERYELAAAGGGRHRVVARR